MDNEKLFNMPFARVYACYVQKAERKGRTRDEVDEILRWMTGYESIPLEGTIRDFFQNAPQLNPDIEKITGVVCGIRVENVEDPLMRNIRRLDKLVDELAKGKPMEKIFRKID